jgi:hypothetical protein
LDYSVLEADHPGRARKKTRIAELEDEVKDLKERLNREEERAKRSESSEAALRDVIDKARTSLQRVDGPASSGQSSMPSPPSSTDVNERGDADEDFVSVSTDPSLISPPLHFDFSEHGDSVLASAFSGLGPDTEMSEGTVGLKLSNPNTALTFGLPLAPNFDTMSYFWDQVFRKYYINIVYSN